MIGWLINEKTGCSNLWLSTVTSRSYVYFCGNFNLDEFPPPLDLFTQYIFAHFTPLVLIKHICPAAAAAALKDKKLKMAQKCGVNLFLFLLGKGQPKAPARSSPSLKCLRVNLMRKKMECLSCCFLIKCRRCYTCVLCECTFWCVLDIACDEAIIKKSFSHFFGLENKSRGVDVCVFYV